MKTTSFEYLNVGYRGNHEHDSPQNFFIMVMHFCLLFDLWLVLCSDMFLFTVHILACVQYEYVAGGMCIPGAVHEQEKEKEK